mgnify:CR=1 FL=1
MKKFNKILDRTIKDILHYDPNNCVENIVKTVFEAILYSEREVFLENYTIKPNKANGYYERLARSINQYFKLKVPRDRLSLFKPVFLEAIKKQEEIMQDLAFKLYTKGLTTRDIQSIFKDIYGKSLSPSSVSRITKDFEEERKSWLDKKLQSKYYFIYIDAIWVSVRRDTVAKEAFYIVLGLREDLKRDILGVYNIPEESYLGWQYVFKDLKKRGFKQPLLIIADGIQYLENAVKKEFPGTKLQKCLVHKIRNILLKARSKHKDDIVNDFHFVFELESDKFQIEDGKKRLDDFILKWQRIYPSIRYKFKDEHIDHYFAYIDFPHLIHRMIYTTNWIERLNKTIRKTEKVRNSFPNPDSALNLICAILMDVERNKLKYPVTSFIKIKDKLDEKLSLLHQTQ